MNRTEAVQALEALLANVGTYPVKGDNKKLYCAGVGAFRLLFSESKQACCTAGACTHAEQPPLEPAKPHPYEELLAQARKHTPPRPGDGFWCVVHDAKNNCWRPSFGWHISPGVVRFPTTEAASIAIASLGSKLDVFIPKEKIA